MTEWGNIAERAARAFAAQRGEPELWRDNVAPMCAVFEALEVMFRARAKGLKETEDPDEYTRGWDDGTAHVCDWFQDAVDDADEIAA